jgi:2,3-bisphosphoglycerate-dependent phosphoglycerate mutase
VTELLFIRHGETDWNRRPCFQGQIDVPLNATGHAQAERLAARLAAERFDAFFTSDLQRAQQTAAPVAAVWQQPPVVLPGLREQRFGEWEGLDFTTIQERWPALWPRWLAHDDPDFAVPGGESARRFHTRVLDAVKALADQAGREGRRRAAVVTHGGVLDMLWRTAGGLTLAAPRQCPIPNAGLNRLRWVDGSLVVDAWADDEHVRDLLQPPVTPAALAQAPATASSAPTGR